MLLIVLLIIRVFDLAIFVQSAGYMLFEDGSFIVGFIRGCIPYAICSIN
jgi:hypothetical protein